MLKKRKFVVLAAITGLLTLGAGIAFAAWTASGAGTGRAAATSAALVTVSVASGVPDLYPGASDGDLYFSLDNPNPYPVTFTAMAPGAGGVVSSDEENCPATNVSLAPTSSITVAVGAGATTSTSIVDVVSMAEGAPDGCQGVTFDFSVMLAGDQGLAVS
jgi:hypothetical protein